MPCFKIQLKNRKPIFNYVNYLKLWNGLLHAVPSQSGGMAENEFSLYLKFYFYLCFENVKFWDVINPVYHFKACFSRKHFCPGAEQTLTGSD